MGLSKNKVSQIQWTIRHFSKKLQSWGKPVVWTNPSGMFKGKHAFGRPWSSFLGEEGEASSAKGPANHKKY
jgi:hypothetical protein